MKKAASVTVSRPSIVLNDVTFGVGTHVNYAYLTLKDAVALRKLLNEGIDEYVRLYGDADWRYSA